MTIVDFTSTDEPLAMAHARIYWNQSFLPLADGQPHRHEQTFESWFAKPKYEFVYCEWCGRVPKRLIGHAAPFLERYRKGRP